MSHPPLCSEGPASITHHHSRFSQRMCLPVGICTLFSVQRVFFNGLKNKVLQTTFLPFIRDLNSPPSVFILFVRQSSCILLGLT